MDPILLADDASFTPISKLKQAAKANAKSKGIKLALALDEQARTLGRSRWDDLISSAWSVSPVGSPDNPNKEHHLIRGITPEGSLIIGYPSKEASDGGLPEYASLYLSQDEHGVAQTVIFSSRAHLGRHLALSQDDLDAIAPGTSLQAQSRAYIGIALRYLDRIPMQIAPVIEEMRQEVPDRVAERPSHADTILLAAEIPGSKERFEVDLPLATSAQLVRDEFRNDDTPGLYGFRLQKDGSLLLRRAKLEDEGDARAALKTATKTLAFLNWTGLHYPKWPNEDKARHEAYMIAQGNTGQLGKTPYDHYHTFSDRKTGQTVVLNQPYQGNGTIGHFGLLNLLAERTITAEAPRYAGLHRGSRTLFHAFAGQGVDIHAIAQGAKIAATVAHNEVVRRVSSSVKAKSGNAKRRSNSLVSPIGDIKVDLDGLPSWEKHLLQATLPDIQKLQAPHWKRKMKAFEGEEHLSWAIQDKYNATGVSVEDVVNAIRKCPLDADLWGFFDIFELSDDTKVELFRRGVVAGETFLGRRMSSEVGYFWGILDTRPYMRCMNMLYRQLVKMRRPAEAAPIGRKMLELCPNDNIGIRFTIDEVEAAATHETLASGLAEAFTDEDHDQAASPAM